MGLVTPFCCTRCSVMMILNLSESLAKPLVMAKLNMAYLSSSKNQQTAVVLLAGVTISGTPCPRHFTVPFGAEAPSDHVVQAWAIPPPSWGLLSQWHRQETATQRQTERPPPEPSDILKRFCALYDDKLHYFIIIIIIIIILLLLLYPGLPFWILYHSICSHSPGKRSYNNTSNSFQSVQVEENCQTGMLLV